MCPQCKRGGVFAPKSDVIAFFPVCKKCQVQMIVVGKAQLLDWVKQSIQLIHNFF